jgi:Na+-transporting NADH:ubiquinone oxidoreductase subunit NqrB
MHPLAIAYSVISLLTLLFGLAAWWLTSSRSVAFLAFFGSACLLFAAHYVQTGTDIQLTYFVPFIVFALFGGRAIGLAYRSLAEKPLRLPSLLLGGITVC